MSRPAGPYSPVLRCGDWVICSGQVGLLAATDAQPGLVPGGFPSELRQALANLANLLGREGATLDQVMKTTVFLIDMADYAALNEIWMETFVEHRPTRSAVAVAALPIGACVEVEAWAFSPVSTPIPELLD